MLAILRTDDPNIFVNLVDTSSVILGKDVDGDLTITMRCTRGEIYVITKASIDYDKWLRQYKCASAAIGSKFEYTAP
jgi:hypothetical protein